MSRKLALMAEGQSHTFVGKALPGVLQQSIKLWKSRPTSRETSPRFPQEIQLAIGNLARYKQCTPPSTIKSASDDGSVQTSTSDGWFKTTHWSVVLRAGDSESVQANEALETLCRSYWYPLYAYVRRNGHGPHDAQDLTQEFFARLLERKYLRLADRNRGRFRTFLLTSLKHFLINEWNKGNCEKRGGGRQVISLDADDTETRFRAEPADEKTPEKAFDRRWAMLVLSRVLDQLQAELTAEGKGSLFEALKSTLIGVELESTYAEIAQRLGVTEGNLKVTVHRLRGRYRELLRAEVGRTVDGPEAIDDEIRELFAALNN